MEEERPHLVLLDLLLPGSDGIEYGVLYELSVHGGRALTHDLLLERIWGPERKSEPWLVREVVKKLRRKLGDNANNPKYVLTEPRVNHRMAKEGRDGE